jgi:hypothetical protein
MDNQFRKYLKLPFPVYQLLMGLGMLLLAIEPISWLIGSWLEPAHDSKGGWLFLLCAVLFFWSVHSPISDAANLSHKKAVLLLFGTALFRGIGQVFAVNVLGAVALTIDVYAIGLLARQPMRQWHNLRRILKRHIALTSPDELNRQLGSSQNCTSL